MIAAKNDPSRARKKLLTLAGASGILAAIVGPAGTSSLIGARGIIRTS